MTALVFLDTETTSLAPDRRPWEIGMIRRDADGSETETHLFVDVDDLSRADPFSLTVGGFYERHPTGRVLAGFERGSDERVCNEGEAAATVAMVTHGAHVVGVVPSFDTECLAALLRRHNLVPAWHYHPRDVEDMAVGWLVGRGYATSRELRPPLKSDHVSRLCGVEPPGEDERHTALGDARWVRRWWDVVMAPEMGDEIG